jgi:hypothetical protein
MGSFTMALHSRLAEIAFALACALCTAGPIAATAQEHGTASQNAGQNGGQPAGFCRTAGAPFGVAPNTPHWNGWGVDPSQHRYQPSGMAQLAAADVPHLKLKWAFGYPGGSCLRTTDDRGGPLIRRQPERKSLFARRR